MKITKRNVLFIIGWPLTFGGHIFSTLSYITEISKMGVDVYLLAQRGPLSRYFECIIEGMFYNRYLNRTKLVNLVTVFHLVYIIIRYRIRIIHAQDFQSLRPALLASIVTNRRLIFTKAGGQIPRYKLPLKGSIIVYSAELYNGLLQKSRKLRSRMMLMKPRIDTLLYSPTKVNSSFLHKHSLFYESEIKILCCIRFAASKKHVLDSLFKLANSLLSHQMRIVLIIVGDGSLFDMVDERSKTINSKMKNVVVKVIKGLNSINEMVQFYNYADIIIGHGRGILEAMSCGKPVICVGKNDMCSVVQSNNVDTISYYNFSGRHLDHCLGKGSNIHDALIRLIKNTHLRKMLGRWGREYIQQHYSSRLLTNMIHKIYNKT